MFKTTVAIILMLSPLALSVAQDKIELETTIIKGNKELPKTLYIVPWKDVKPAKLDQQELLLHSLSDDLFDPVMAVQY